MKKIWKKVKEIKNKIITELKSPKMPNFEFLFSKDSLENSLELLKYLLDQEKQKFYKKLSLENSKITFKTFNDDSLLDIFWSYLNYLKWIYNTDKIREIIEEFEPLLMDFNNYVSYNKRYYEMLCYLLEKSNLDTQQEKIICDSIKSYKVRWINLDTKKQDKLKKINKRLSELSINFSNNELDSENNFFYHIETDEYLSELPKEILTQAKKMAIKKKKSWYYFTANPSEYTAIMNYCSSSDIRYDFYVSRHSFASNWKYDNRKIVLEILQLREKKAKLLWYKNFAELSLEFKMANTPKQVIDLLIDINKKAIKKAKEEILELEKYFKVSNLKPWDLNYYFRKYKEENYNINYKELKKYFEFEKVLSWLHEIVFRLYWLKFKQLENSNKNLFLKDARFYEVYDKDNSLISYYILDPFYKSEKEAWAWSDNIRDKHEGRIPIIINVCNFNPPSIKHKGSNVSLLSFLEVETLFHEFWHAIHEISSKTSYSDLTWFGVEWDFVEVPSQFMEHYIEDKESLDIFSEHYITWKLLPEKLIDSLKKSEKLWSWNFVIKQNEFALLDMVLHLEKAPIFVKELDEKTIDIANKFSIHKKIDNYKMYASFSHIFAWWYAAGYYSYMWAEIIELDIWAEFKKKGIFNKRIADRFFAKILSAWSTKKASKMFYEFMWREVSLFAFFERKGI